MMRIGFIGAGNVGTAFGVYLSKHGFSLSGYHSRSEGSAKRAAKLTRSTMLADQAALIKVSDLIFITCNDDQIKSVAHKIAKSDIGLQKKSFAHMSGALSSVSLIALKDRGASIYSIHPMQSFAEIEKSVEDLSETCFGIEGQSELETVLSIFKKTGNAYIILSPEQKTEYHIASCVVSNYLTAVLNYGFERMESIGIQKSDAMAALAPMIRGTVENILQLGPEQALTGPIARGDVGTIEKHLQALHPLQQKIKTNYKSLGSLTLDLAAKHKLTNQEQLQRLADLLS